MRAVKYLPHYTVADYRHWEGDWELIEGIPYAMSPSPVRRHQDLVFVLRRQIAAELELHKGCAACSHVHDLDWLVNDDTVLRPDIAITCNQKEKFITAAPVLIIEILSPATAVKDRQIKYEIYKERKVKYYILVNPENKTCNIFHLHDNGYEETEDASFSIHEGCAITLDFEKALAEVE